MHSTVGSGIHSDRIGVSFPKFFSAREKQQCRKNGMSENVYICPFEKVIVRPMVRV
ncbi:hypothetical protein D3OALGA1CA_3904 [Olavius algarvensis associated proteobacterium Delta 3]|nr:hypothetical protein D3OALGA1CA_3904 [Olavius algarvensis associated proteobacterium Delta 3]